MFNVTVIRLKDIVKIVIVLITIYILSKFIFKDVSIKNNLSQSIHFQTIDFVKLGINTESNIIKYISNQDAEKTEEVEEDDKNISIKKILQIGSNLFQAKEVEKDIGQDEEKQENNQSQETQTAQTNQVITDVSTQVVTEHPIAEKYNKEYNGVKIKNETSYELTDEMLNPNNLEIKKENVLIFHTHTCESYTQSEIYKYTPSGNYRTTDLNYSVARVGEELKNHLGNYGFSVNHNQNFHDYPNYTGSYNRSLSTVQNVLKDFQSDIIIDLHRDAIGSDENYAPLVKIGDDYCAQLMFVMGTDGGGLSHPNWNSNLKFAVKIQEKANELYPGLCKPIILRNSRYNQHLGKAACIIEVGATGNTLDQTLASMKYLAKIMSEALK